MTDKDPDLLSARDVAEELGITVYILKRHMIATGILPAEKVRAAWIIQREDLDLFKKRGRATIARIKTSCGPAERGRKGAETTLKRHGPKFFKKIGRKGGQTTKERHGDEFYEAIGHKAAEAAAAKRRRERARGAVEGS